MITTSLLRLAVAGIIGLPVSGLTITKTQICHVGAWQFDAGNPAKMARHLGALKLYYRSRHGHQVMSAIALAIPPRSISLTGFREIIAGYRHELGLEEPLTIDSVERQGAVEILQFHSFMLDQHNVRQKLCTRVWRYRWSLLEVNYAHTTDPNVVRNETILLKSVKLTKAPTGSS